MFLVWPKSDTLSICVYRFKERTKRSATQKKEEDTEKKDLQVLNVLIFYYKANAFPGTTHMRVNVTYFSKI